MLWEIKVSKGCRNPMMCESNITKKLVGLFPYFETESIKAKISHSNKHAQSSDLGFLSNL